MITKVGVTEDELMALGSDARVEVVDGEIVEMAPVGIRHQLIARNLLRILDHYVAQNDLGEVFQDSLIYLLHREGRRLRGARIPDVSYVQRVNLPPDYDVDRPYPGAPTLAIEVMSPDDKAEDVQKRIVDYLSAGTLEVWVVYPEAREVHQHRGDTDHVRVYRVMTEALEIALLFPGLTLTMNEIFELPEWASKQQDA